MPKPLSALALVAAVLTAQPAWADEAATKDPAFKLTVGAYHFSQSGWGLDTNLRHTSKLGNVWGGYFRSAGLESRQWRAGWDHSFGDAVRVQPSIQTASGGHWGGSLNVETGERWVLGAGFGRTNLRPYYNLNFDPNDAWSLLVAWRDEGGRSLSASFIRDNRQNPDQRHFHLIWREPMPARERLTVDVLLKRGLVDSRWVSRAGATVTYDWPRFFARLAFDPYTNFTPDHAWRLSIGTRF